MNIQITSKTGETIDAELVLPATPGPAVVIVHEYWGLNDHVRSLATRLANDGFVALAVDLYRGEIAQNSGRAQELMVGLDRARALADIAGAVAYLGAQPQVKGRVGVMGFCMGGALTLAAAASLGEAIGGAVAFYGIPGQLDSAKISAPILAHFSLTDPWAKPALGEALRDEMTARGQKMTLHVYDAQHAFVNDTRPEVYHPAAAALAWSRTVSFFRETLR